MKKSKITPKKSYIIPFKERRMADIVFAVFSVVVFAVATVFFWVIVAGGAADMILTAAAVFVTIGFVCSLIALVTGHMEWLLLDLLTLY